MRRTAAGIVLATMLLSPAYGITEPKRSETSAPSGWWDNLVRQVIQLIATGVSESVEATSNPGEDGKDNPTPDAGTTWDDHGNA